MKIGAQLYTAKKHFTNLEDFDKSLGVIKGIGYSTVQVSGTCAYDPYWLRDTLQKYDVNCGITHVDPKRLLDEPEQLMKEHEIFGCKHIGIGGMPMEMRGSLEGYREFCKLYVPVAKTLQSLGAKLMYHNHWFEFDKLEGRDVIERMLEDFPEDALDFTLDIGWAAFADKDVEKLIDTLKGRLSRVHLKDYADMPTDGSITTKAYLRPIYEGKLDYDAYIKALLNAGTEYAYVEQDWCYDEDEFDCLKRSYENVTSRFPEMK